MLRPFPQFLSLDRVSYVIIQRLRHCINLFRRTPTLLLKPLRYFPGKQQYQTLFCRFVVPAENARKEQEKIFAHLLPSPEHRIKLRQNRQVCGTVTGVKKCKRCRLVAYVPHNFRFRKKGKEFQLT
jgi:hypothetical protein